MIETTDEQKLSFMAHRTWRWQEAIEHRENWAKENGCENFAQATLIGLVRVSHGKEFTNPSQILKSVVTHEASAERAAELSAIIDARMQR